jgi:DNA-binding response OmpR family regulator
MSTPRRVLIVDDDVDFIDILEHRLTSEGFSVSRALDGEAGLDAIRSERPDVILLDVQMPKRSGLQVLEALRQQPDTWRMPILMLSARSDSATVFRAMELGADDYVCKPISLRAVVELVRECIRPHAAALSRAVTLSAERVRLIPI